MKKVYLYRVCVLSAFLGSYSIAVLGDSGLCQDLADFACAAGEHNDGTGVQSRSDEESALEMPLSKFRERRPQIKEKVMQLFKGDSNRYFFNLAKSAMGLGNSPDCESSEAKALEKCKNDVAEGMTDFLKSIILYGTPKTGVIEKVRDIKEKTLLVSTPAFEKMATELRKEFDKSTQLPELESEIRNRVFPDLQKAIARRIQRMNIPDKQKQFMIDKVMGNTFEGTSCYSDESILKNFEPNAFNDPVSHTFQICKGLLRKGGSLFSIAGIIVHELTHDIDPCHISIGPEKEKFKYKPVTTMFERDDQYPIEGLVGCLRSPKSIGAARDWSKSGMMYTPYPVNPPNTYEFPTKMPDANSSLPVEPKSKASGGFGPYGRPLKPIAKDIFDFCTKDDQIGEAVSDWFVPEVVPDYIESRFPNLTEREWQIGASNIFRPICNLSAQMEKSDTDAELSNKAKFDEHPPLHRRIDSILLQSPKIRAKMGCKEPHETYIYCDADKPEVLKSVAADYRAKVFESMKGYGAGTTTYPAPIGTKQPRSTQEKPPAGGAK